MSKIKDIFSYSCQKATEMVEKKKLVGLSFIEKIKLKMHLSACKACEAYEKQSEVMDKKICQHTEAKNINELEEKLSEDIKRKIIGSIGEY